MKFMDSKKFWEIIFAVNLLIGVSAFFTEDAVALVLAGVSAFFILINYGKAKEP